MVQTLNSLEIRLAFLPQAILTQSGKVEVIARERDRPLTKQRAPRARMLRARTKMHACGLVHWLFTSSRNVATKALELATTFAKRLAWQLWHMSPAFLKMHAIRQAITCLLIGHTSH